MRTKGSYQLKSRRDLLHLSLNNDVRRHLINTSARSSRRPEERSPANFPRNAPHWIRFNQIELNVFGSSVIGLKIGRVARRKCSSKYRIMGQESASSNDGLKARNA